MPIGYVVKAGVVWTFLAGIASAQALVASPGGGVPGDAGRMIDFLLPNYAYALAALAGWTVLTMVLTFLSTIGTPRGRSEGGHPVRDYSDPAYRRSRAHLNAVETAAPFLAALIAAILTGASPVWINGLAVMFLLARIGMAVVHIGTENQPLRSIFFVIGQICMLLLAGFALVAALTS